MGSKGGSIRDPDVTSTCQPPNPSASGRGTDDRPDEDFILRQTETDRLDGPHDDSPQAPTLRSPSGCCRWGAPRLPDSPSIRMDVWKGEVIASTEEELLSRIQR